MLGAYITIGILVTVLVLVVVAWSIPKAKKYKLQSPIKKIEPKKKTIRRKTKKNKQIWIRIR